MGSYAVCFHNGDDKHAVESLPPRQLNDSLAVTLPGRDSFDSEDPGDGVQRLGSPSQRDFPQGPPHFKAL